MTFELEEKARAMKQKMHNYNRQSSNASDADSISLASSVASSIAPSQRSSRPKMEQHSNQQQQPLKVVIL